MLTRRHCLTCLLLGAGVLGTVREGHAEESQAEGSKGKLSKQDAQYVDRPVNGQFCANCKFYIPAGGGGPGFGMMGGRMGPSMMAPGTCQVVEGSIRPMGWCVLYQPIPGYAPPSGR